MDIPKFKSGDKVFYHETKQVIDKILMKHEKGYLYSLIGMSNLAVVEHLLTPRIEITPLTH